MTIHRNMFKESPFANSLSDPDEAKYRRLIEGKNVAIVGPASYIQDLSLGKEIDKYDLIVRINRSIESVENNKKSIGSRTDILYSCLIEKPENAGKIVVKDLLDSHKIQYVCAPPKSSFEGVSEANVLSDLIKEETLKEIKYSLPFRIVDQAINNKISSVTKCRPNTGFLAIYDLLDKSPKKLGIYGFSFYLDGFVTGTKTGMEMSEEKFANKCFISKRHNQVSLWSYAKSSLLKDDRVYLDPYLNCILELKELDRKQFFEKVKKIKEKSNA